MTNEISSAFKPIDWTIPTVIDYFKKNDVLEIPARTPLILRDIYLIHDRKFPWENDDRYISNLSVLFDKYFHPILTVIGKKLNIAFENPEAKFNLKTACGDLEFDTGCKVTLKTEKASAIYTRISDLFRFMALSSITTVDFSPDQVVKIKLTDDDLDRYKPKETAAANFKRLMASRLIPAGYGYKWDFSGEVTLSLEKIQSTSTKEENSLCLSRKEGIRFTLTEDRLFDSIEEFRNRLRIAGKITIPAGEKLIIRDPCFKNILDHAPKISGKAIIFVLDHIIAPLGKSREIQPPKVYCTITDDELTLSSDDVFTFLLKIGVTQITDCRDFVLSILKSRVPLKIPPNNQLIFHDAPKGPSENPLISLLEKYTPVGYRWIYDFKDLTGFQSNTLVIESPHPIYLRLEWMNGEGLISLLLENSAPELSTGLRDGDEEAVIFILFKALFYLTYGDYISDEPPPFFKPTTQAKMKALIKSLTEEEKVMMEKILKSTPKEFNELDLKTLPESITSLVIPIRELVYDELYGSPLNDAITKVGTKLRAKAAP